MHKYIHFIVAKLVYKAKMTYRLRVNISPNQCHKTKSTSAYSNRTKNKMASDTMFQPTNLYPFNCTSYFGLLWIGLGLGLGQSIYYMWMGYVW